MTQTPATSDGNHFAISFLRSILLLLLYLFILWCASRLPHVWQYFSSCGSASSTSASDESVSQNRHSEDNVEDEEGKVPNDDPSTRVLVQQPKESYGTQSAKETLHRSKKNLGDVSFPAQICRCMRRLLCCGHSLPTSSASSLSSAQMGRLSCSLPSVPPVLFLLLTGVVARELLEFINYRQSVHQLQRAISRANGMGGGKGTVLQPGADTVPFFEPWEASSHARVNVVDEMLSLSTPFFLFGLATIGLDIGSHLAYPQLTIVKKQLCFFLLFLFPIVFVGMAAVFRIAGARLMKSSARADWLRASLDLATGQKGTAGATVRTAKAADASVASSSWACSQRAGVALGGAPADLLSPPTETSSRHTVATVMDTFERYEDASLWCFALVMAAITVERSSPEFINSIYHTGARGVLPIFILCVTACQDIVALILFVLVSSVIRPAQVNGAKELLSQIATLVASSSRDANPRSPKNNGNETDMVGSKTQALESSVKEEEQGAAKELLLIAAATLGAAVTSFLLRKLWLWVLRRMDERMSSSSTADTVVTTRADASDPLIPEQAQPVVYASFGLLAVLTTNLALWSVLTPCELLLAAVITGSGASFFVPCPFLHLSVGAMNEVTNVVLFTTMGFRTRFSSYAVPTSAQLLEEGQRAKGGLAKTASFLPSRVTPPAFSAVLGWGVFFFTVRVVLLWLAGFVGATVTSVERLVNRYTTPPSHGGTPTPQQTVDEGGNARSALLTSAASATLKRREDGRGDRPLPESVAATAGTPVKPITGVRNWIGFALVTQLAIALTLNGRGGDEYEKRMAAVLSHDYFLSSGVAKGKATGLVLASLSPSRVVLSIAPLVQAYTISIALAIVAGPILGSWVLRKGTTRDLGKR